MRAPTSCGRPVPVAEVQIMSADGESQARRGEVGELWARGPMVAKGYWRNPEATAATFVDGWVRTGDLARRSEEHTSELQSLMRISYAVFCLQKNIQNKTQTDNN